MAKKGQLKEKALDEKSREELQRELVASELELREALHRYEFIHAAEMKERIKRIRFLLTII